jgi:hypothetical protein
VLGVLAHTTLGPSCRLPLQKSRSAPQPGQHVFDSRDRASLVAFGQVDKQPNPLALLSDNPAVLFQLIIDADDPINPHRVSEALDENRLLFFGQNQIFD